MSIPRALSIGGSDPSGGAGIQQDIRTFAALGVWGMAAVAAVTVQNSRGLLEWMAIPAETIGAQIDAVLTDIGVDAAKTGMLGTAAAVEVIARAARDHGISRLVVDPVLSATVGGSLADEDLAGAILDSLAPLAFVIVPNAREAERLTGVEVSTPTGQIEAGRALVARGARAALVKGGHVEGLRARDVLVLASGEVVEFEAPWVDTPNTHGTGCVFSAAIAGGLAAGWDLIESIRRAKGMVTRALERSLALGGGVGPVDPGPPPAEPWPLAGHPFE